MHAVVNDSAAVSPRIAGRERERLEYLWFIVIAQARLRRLSFDSHRRPSLLQLPQWCKAGA